MGNVLKLLLACLCFVSLNAQKYSGQLSIEDGGIEVAVQIFSENEIVRVTMVGPVETWFAIGFGKEKMKGSYALLVSINGVEERFLDGRDQGKLLPSSIKITSDAIIEGKRKVILERPLQGKNQTYYSFPNASLTIPVIYAIGKNEKTNRKHAQRGQAILDIK